MNKKLKIFRLITRMNVGGPAVHVSLLNDLNCNTKLYFGKTEENEDEYIPEDIFLMWQLQNLKKSINIKEDIKIIKAFINEIKLFDPDIIHTHLSKAGFVGRIAGIIYNLKYKKKVKLVHTYHGTIFKDYFGFFRSKLYLYIERFLALFTDKIIAISESQKEALIKFGFNKKKIEVVKLGIDLKSFLNEREPKKDEVINVGIIGRLESIKNHKMFLDAIVNLKSNGFHFYIIGDGSLRSELEDYAKTLSIRGKITFTGNVDRNILAGYYGYLDVVVNTSLNEGTPLSIIEAMASGCLVIATDAGGTKDLFGLNQVNLINGVKYCSNGYLIESNNYKQLAMMLRYYQTLSDTDYIKKRLQNARKYAIENHSKERLLNDMTEVYNELIESDE